MTGARQVFCFACFGLAFAAILAACSGGDGEQYALRAVFFGPDLSSNVSDTDYCDLKVQDVAVGEEAAMLLREERVGGGTVSLTGPRMTLVDGPANATLEQLDATAWRLTFTIRPPDDFVATFVPQAVGEYAVVCIGGLGSVNETMRVLGD